ncbi:hypothetical protein SAMN05421869_12375 [Nonomuraea jiangxiensis]|uniref:Uncharacterized protein n=1 Tax=Nonomuraea jiangxiensis TaxID=633440 RepID=A0A1G9I4C4_9ACTN|nr:hypothetical protein SAMN05421869_12375 [Nonomuraea jiangxiensis]
MTSMAVGFGLAIAIVAIAGVVVTSTYAARHRKAHAV